MKPSVRKAKPVYSLRDFNSSLFNLSDIGSNEPVTIDEIGTELRKQRRFGGQTSFTVLEHSLFGAVNMLYRHPRYPKLALDFLLHDAHEIFLTDIPSPVLKALGPATEKAMAKLKAELDWWIYDCLNLDIPTKEDKAAVHRFDKMATDREARWLFPNIDLDPHFGEYKDRDLYDLGLMRSRIHDAHDFADVFFFLKQLQLHPDEGGRNVFYIVNKMEGLFHTYVGKDYGIHPVHVQAINGYNDESAFSHRP